MVLLQSQQIYQGRCRSDNPPHIYAVADAAHQALMHQKQHQAIVISGESGAGKTESANLLLKQLVFLSKVFFYIICTRARAVYKYVFLPITYLLI